MEGTLFYPDFLPEYSCKCDACRHTCCVGTDWKISLTKEEYQKITNRTAGQEIFKLAVNHFQLFAEPDEKNYAYMKSREDGRCFLLREDGLCSWHISYGEPPCSVCRDFPRLYSRILEDEYTCPSAACEAVLELFLKKKSPITLLCHPVADTGYHNDYICVTKENALRRPVLHYYSQIVNLGLSILQNRRFSLDERLLILTEEMWKLAQYERSGRIEEWPKEADRIIDWARWNGTEDFFEDAAPLNEAFGKNANIRDREVHICTFLRNTELLNGGAQAMVLICGEVYSSFLDSPAYRDIAIGILDGLGIGVREGKGEHGNRTVSSGISGHYSLYLADSTRYLSQKNNLSGYLSEQEILLEHVLVSIFLRNMVPLINPGIWECFQFFAVCYALLKGGLIGTFSSAPDDEQLVDCFVTLLRMIEHNSGLYEKTLRRMQELCFTDREAVCILIRG